MFSKIRINSIRWRIVFIYALLVFIAMTILGSFIMQQLEDYYVNSVSENLTKTVEQGNLLSFNYYDSLKDHSDEIQQSIEEWSRAIPDELFIVDPSFTIIASTNMNLLDRNALNFLEETLLITGISGIQGELDGTVELSVSSDPIPVKNMVFPIGEEGDIKGVLYIRSNMSTIYETINQSKTIFVQAVLIALVITFFLGFLISRSITTPINDLTAKAEKMSQGDFSQVVEVKSNDEIGRLAEMFNLLRVRLDTTLSEITSEKSKLETILNNMADGLIAVNLNGRIMHANHVAMKMLRVGDADVKYKKYDDIISKYSTALTLGEIKKHREGTENFEFGGKTFYAKYARFKGENNKDLGIVMILQDITEQQKLEKMQREFVANVSHELKTPLTTIKSYTETLLETEVEDSETARHFLSVVDMEADRMSRLVSDLLQLSRLDYKKEKWNKKDYDLISILQSVHMRMELTAKNQNQSFRCLFSEDMQAIVNIDKDRIEQVILNVVSNALKYTPPGGDISLDIEKTEASAIVTVTDTGIGIPEEDIPLVFERFYRVDKARSRAMGGTGLGLAIAKQIVEEHDGEISIVSKEQEGSIVTITLPISKSYKTIDYQ